MPEILYATALSLLLHGLLYQISPKGLKEIYAPYAPIRCELQLNNAIGEPIPGKLSVSIRDAVRSDYMEYDNNIFTDLLLTSDLKGYIHQPGYYFTESSLRKQKELDILLMVHGWRKYDMTQQIGISHSPHFSCQKANWYFMDKSNLRFSKTS